MEKKHPLYSELAAIDEVKLSMEKKHPLYSELAAIVGSKYVSDEDFVLWAYSKDAGPFPGKAQGIVVRPGSTEEVVEIVKLANATRTPIVPRGGMAGLYGAPPGMPGRGIVVDMTRMNKIIKIDEENLTVTAEAGISMGELYTKVGEKGYEVFSASMPHYTDTLGGRISGAVGAGASRHMTGFGYNWPHVLGLKVVLPNGSVLDTNAPGINVFEETNYTRTGEYGSPDITGMFIADNGIFGIKVEATIRMVRRKPFSDAIMSKFDTVDNAWNAVYELMEIEPGILEMMLLVSPKTSSSMFGLRPSWTVMASAEGYSEEEVKRKLEIFNETCKKYGGRPGTPAEYKMARMFLVAEFFGDMGRFAGRLGRWSLLEVCCSRKDFLKCFKTGTAWLEEQFKKRQIENKDVKVSEIIVPIGANRGIMSLAIYYREADPVLHKKVVDLSCHYFEYMARHGWLADANNRITGQITAKYWSPEFKEFMVNLKRTLDPNNIMNPGIWNL
jgi:FAD/FMN-containing dehydrogenase